MSASEPPVQYHDVVGVAVIIGEGEGYHPQEVFRYPFFNEDPAFRSLGHFDRIPPNILTKLLRTTVSALSGELLEMVYDGVRLISRPVELFPERGDADRTAVFFSLVFAISSDHYPRRQLYPPSRLPKHPRLKGIHSAPPPGTIMTAAADDPGGVGGEDPEIMGGGFPTAEGMLDRDSAAIELEHDARDEEGRTPWGRGRAAGGEREREREHGVDLALLRGAVMMVSRAMCHEEWKNGYISKAGKHLLEKKERRKSDTEQFIHDMEKLIEGMHSQPLHNGSGLYTNFGGRLYGGAWQYSADEMKARGEEKWLDSVMQESQLARDMRTLFEGLARGEPFEMTIKRASGLSINVTVQREIPATRRFETLLLREEKHIALRGHPRDGSPQIKRLIEIADPHKTLEELAHSSEIELAQMLRLVRHLVFWGEGRVIDTLCGSNRYQVTREAIKASMPGSPVLAEFSGRFPKRDLMHELSRFGEMRPLSAILNESKRSTHKNLIAVLTLLLRRDLLVQVQHYVTLAIPEPSPPNADTESDDDDYDSDTDDSCSDTNGDGDGNADRGGARRRSIRGDRGASDAGPAAAAAAVRNTAATAAAITAGGDGGGAAGDVDDLPPSLSSSSLAKEEVSGRLTTWTGAAQAGRNIGAFPTVEAVEAGISPISEVATTTTTTTSTTSTGGSIGGGTFHGPFHGSVVGYAVDAAGNTWFETPKLEPFEEEYLQSIDDGSEASKLLRRLAPLLRGKLSMREIIWRLEITNTAFLEHVLEKYYHILYEVWRPAVDPDAT